MTESPLTPLESRSVAVLLVQVQAHVIPTLRAQGLIEIAEMIAISTRDVVADPRAAGAVQLARTMGFSEVDL